MTRALHTNDLCTTSSKTLQEELETHLTGDVLVLAPTDDRLTGLVPINGQITLNGSQLTFDEHTTFYTAPLYNTHTEQDSYFPHNKTERFHFNTNSYDTVVALFSLCGYFQRGPPFMDMTRICRPNGTLLSITGLQPNEPLDQDAKWWVPSSNDATLNDILILNHTNYQTPTLIAKFTVTSDTPRHPNATITTQPE